MVVPDEKIEAYLDLKADSALLQALCERGVIPSPQYLKAVAFVRTDFVWAKYALFFIRLLAAVFLTAGGFLLCLSLWQNLYTQIGFNILLVLFIFFGITAYFLNRFSVIGQIADYATVLLIGALVFLPAFDFNIATQTCDQLLLWGALFFLWACLSKRIGIKILFFVFLNTVLVCYAYQVWLPFGFLKYTLFLGFLSCFNAIALAIREICACFFKVPLLNNPMSRIVPLIFIFVPLFFQAQGFFVPWILLVCICTAVFYSIVLPDLFIQKINGLFLFCYLEIVLYFLSLSFFDTPILQWGILAFGSVLLTTLFYFVFKMLFSFISKKRKN